MAVFTLTFYSLEALCSSGTAKGNEAPKVALARFGAQSCIEGEDLVNPGSCSQRSHP